MTLNGQNVTLAEIKKNYGAHQENLNEDRFIQNVKCRLMILVSRNHAPQGNVGKHSAEGKVTESIVVVITTCQLENTKIMSNTKCPLHV